MHRKRKDSRPQNSGNVKVCGGRQARSLGMYAWRRAREDLKTWEEMDDRARRARKEKEEKGFYTVDLGETIFSNIGLRLFPHFVSVLCFWLGRAGSGVVAEAYTYSGTDRQRVWWGNRVFL